MHAHDWQAGLAPVYLKTLLRDTSAARRRRVGLHDPQPRLSGVVRARLAAAARPAVGAAWHRATRVLGTISFLKGGINDADVITTVSPQYAKEIQTPVVRLRIRRHPSPALGRSGRHPERHRHRAVGSGARSATCPGRSACRTFPGKRRRKPQCWSEFNLPADSRTRRPPAHRHDFADGRSEGVRSDRGSGRRTGHAWTPRSSCSAPAIRAIRISGAPGREFPDRIGARIGFDEGLAHLIEGGADIFLMPSRFEPCGLNQMYSLGTGPFPLSGASED